MNSVLLIKKVLPSYLTIASYSYTTGRKWGMKVLFL